MNGRKILSRFAALLTAGLLAAGAASAEASLSYNGVVVAGETLPVAALFGGKVAEVMVRTGDLIRKGDEIAQIATTLNYAPL